MPPKSAYTTAPIGKTMVMTAFSMLAGTLAMSGYNLVDSYFIGKLGGENPLPLAAIGFTMPVVMILGCVFHGIAAGIMTTVSHAAGGGKQGKAAKLVTAGFLFSAVTALGMGILGMLTVEPTFRLFNANAEVMPFIREYMYVWYIGSFTGALAMTGNNILISLGSARAAGLLMMAGMILNAILDPLMIFGLRMGMAGAAWATVISQFFSAAAVFLILHRHYRMIDAAALGMRFLTKTGGMIFQYAGPAILGMLMMPIGSTVITWITASFGNAAVAASATAMRVEMVAFVFPMSLGMSLMPMIGQNYGAKCYSRIRKCFDFSMKFAFFFLLAAGIAIVFLAPWAASLFTQDKAVQEIMVGYLRIIPWGFGMIEIHRYSGFFYTGCGKPSASAWLNALRVLGLHIPLSLIALYFHSLNGVFFARLGADLLAGGIGCFLSYRMTRRLPKDGESV